MSAAVDTTAAGPPGGGPGRWLALLVGLAGVHAGAAAVLGAWRGLRVIDENGYVVSGQAHGAAVLYSGEVEHAAGCALVLGTALALLVLPLALRRRPLGGLGFWAHGVQLACWPLWITVWSDWRVVRPRYGLELPALLWHREELVRWGVTAAAVLVAWGVLGAVLARRGSPSGRRVDGVGALLAGGAGLAVALGLVLSARAQVGATAPAEVPATNAVFLTWDSTRADRLSLYGYERPTTPNLERFGADAVVYERHYSQNNWTRPSYASMLTSLHGFEMPLGGLQPALTTLAEVFRDAGYATRAFVQNPNLDPELDFDQGFDRFVQVRDAERATEVAERAVAAIDELTTGDRPFFLFVHMQQPHWPYAVGGPYIEEFGAEAEEVVDERVLEKLFRHRLEYWEERADKERDLAWLEDMYDSDVRLADEGVGRIVDHLRARGLLASSVVVFNADHGDEFLDRGDFGHGHDNLHPELTNVPLVVRFPDGLGVAPRRERALSANLDVFPTLLDAVGLPVPDHVSGRSLLALSPEEARGRLVLSSNNWVIAVRGDTRSLVCDQRSGETWLYDLEADPREERPLPAPEEDPEYARLRAVADEWLGRRVERDPPGRGEMSDDLAGRLEDLGYL